MPDDRMTFQNSKVTLFPPCILLEFLPCCTSVITGVCDCVTKMCGGRCPSSGPSRQLGQMVEPVQANALHDLPGCLPPHGNHNRAVLDGVRESANQSDSFRPPDGEEPRLVIVTGSSQHVGRASRVARVQDPSKLLLLSTDESLSLIYHNATSLPSGAILGRMCHPAGATMSLRPVALPMTSRRRRFPRGCRS